MHRAIFCPLSPCCVQSLHGVLRHGMMFIGMLQSMLQAHAADAAASWHHHCIGCGWQAHVSVLLNDAVGTFAGGRYQDEDVMMGVIIGTGTNACYLEKRAHIHNAKLPGPARSDSMLINTEWGCFFSDTLPVWSLFADSLKLILVGLASCHSTLIVTGLLEPVFLLLFSNAIRAISFTS